MKNIMVFVLFAAYSLLTPAQVRKIDSREIYKAGSFELGLTSNMGISQNDISGNDHNGYYYIPGDRGRKFYLNLNAYGGYYLIDGLSIGPELGINLTFDPSTVFLTGNLCYVFNSSSRSIYPYLKIGYGVTDIMNQTEQEPGLFESLNYKLFNLGAGLKILQTSQVAFTVELNYKYITGSDSHAYDPYNDPVTVNSDTKVSVLSFAFGSSIAL